LRATGRRRSPSRSTPAPPARASRATGCSPSIPDHRETRDMSALICGSLAFDTIMTFHGRFAEQILPDQLHILNVSFLVPQLRRDFGGCAGNIAYSLKVLGGTPLPMATIGNDGAGYVDRLQALGISTEFVREVGDTYTAQAM